MCDARIAAAMSTKADCVTGLSNAYSTRPISICRSRAAVNHMPPRSSSGVQGRRVLTPLTALATAASPASSTSHRSHE